MALDLKAIFNISPSFWLICVKDDLFVIMKMEMVANKLKEMSKDLSHTSLFKKYMNKKLAFAGLKTRKAEHVA